jgi:hypothetical protein
MENRRIEYRNGQRLIAKTLDRGYECFIPLFDTGIDYIFFNPQEFHYLNVQLKSRWTIQTKYEGRQIYIAFPYGDEIYLVDHDRMVELVGERVRQTRSYREQGYYHNPKPPQSILSELDTLNFLR